MEGPRAGVARTLVAGAAGYLLGSVPSADVAARLAHGGETDLREKGSGNPGGVNAAAVLGRKWGLGVIVADVAKGALAGFAGRRIGGDRGAYAAATGAIAGHIAPPWSRFRGGKGVATSAGACLAVFPAFFPIDAAVAAAGAAGLQHAERTVQINAAVWTLTAVLWWRARLPNAWGPRPGPGLVAFSAAGSAMILAKFRATRVQVDPQLSAS